MKCKNCSTENEEDVKFCVNCGHKFTSTKKKIKRYLILAYILVGTGLLLWFNRTILTNLSETFDITMRTLAILETTIVSTGIIAGLFCRFRLTLLWLLSPLLFSFGSSIFIYQNKINFNYQEKNIAVEANTNIKEAVYLAYPEFKIIENKYYNIGVAKIIGEMSLDIINMPVSIVNQNINVDIKTIEELNLRFVCENSIVNHIINNNVTVNIGNVTSFGFFGSGFSISVDITNITNRTLTIIIEQGQMLEVQGINVQNIVVNREQIIILQPKETKKITLSASCAAEKRGNPVGYQVKLTPFVLDAPTNVFNSQEDIWNFINPSRRNNR